MVGGGAAECGCCCERCQRDLDDMKTENNMNELILFQMWKIVPKKFTTCLKALKRKITDPRSQ